MAKARVPQHVFFHLPPPFPRRGVVRQGAVLLPHIISPRQDRRDVS